MEDEEEEIDIDGTVEDGIHNQMEGEDYVNLFFSYVYL